VREWCIRARAAGVTGWYIPEMVVQHIIPASRLNKAYFRRWFYWRGVSRAMLYQKSGLNMESPEDTRVDPRTFPHVFGVPRYMFRKACRIAARFAINTIRGDGTAAFEQEIWMCFFAGILRQRFRDRQNKADAAGIPGYSVSP